MPVIPPVVAAVAVAVQEVSGRRRRRGPSPVRDAIAATLAGAAGLTAAASAVTLKQAGTSLDPVVPQKTTKLVDTGPFAYSRNPMYLALITLLAANAVRLGGLLPWLPVVVAWATVDRGQVVREEVVLERAFGVEYVEYTQRVRRWL